MLKNITLSAEAVLIEKARQQAVLNKTTLNALFRQWLERYTGAKKAAQDYDTLMHRLSYAKAPRKFTREEMNER